VTRENRPADAAPRVRPAQPRIAPVPKESWNEAQREFLEPLDQAGRLYNVFSTLANHPELYRDWTTFASYILRRSTLSPRDREILILRIGSLCQAEYEWGQHVRIGKQAGLTDEEIRRIPIGPEAPGWSASDADLLRATDELHHDSRVSDATWARLAARFDQKQMLDLLFAVGQYTLVSMVLNSCGVELDPGVDGFPAGAAGHGG
jgi:alkylhydroperoxidase family enzyme